eukprot:6345073-Ditylum_brightwellii.AAC.1
MTLPQQEAGNKKINYVIAIITEIENKVFSDQTGYFPCVNTRGMWYIMVLYAFDDNYIKGIPIKSRAALESQCANQELTPPDMHRQHLVECAIQT